MSITSLIYVWLFYTGNSLVIDSYLRTYLSHNNNHFYLLLLLPLNFVIFAYYLNKKFNKKLYKKVLNNKLISTVLFCVFGILYFLIMANGIGSGLKHSSIPYLSLCCLFSFIFFVITYSIIKRLFRKSVDHWGTACD